MTHAAGSLTGDKTLEAEGRALGRTGHRETLRVLAQPDGGWVVETGEPGQASSVHRTKKEAVRSVRTLAKAHKPSQVLIYKKDGAVQTERTYRYLFLACWPLSTERKWKIMAQKPAVHIEPRENRWAVVREGSGRPCSVHPAQSEAAKEGWDIARREATEFGSVSILNGGNGMLG